MPSITSFDDWVRQRRKALDLTQAELAAQVGCALVTIKKIEQATRRPSRQMAELLAEALAIPATERETFLRLARHQYVGPGAMPSAAGTVARAGGDELLGQVNEDAQPGNFVGREGEMTQLEAHLTSALNGSGRIVLISGEAGYGKTTLMTQFAQHALQTYPNLIVAGGNCEAFVGAGTPYLPFRDILALLTCDVETPGQSFLFSRDQARRLWSLLPLAAQILVDQSWALIDVFLSGARLRQRILTHPIAVDRCRAQLAKLDQEAVRPRKVPQRRLFEAYAQLLRALAEQQPILLLIDDLQWIDRASAALLFYMVTRLTGSRILLLGTYRGSEVDPSAFSGYADGEQTEAHALVPLLEELRRRFGDVEISLGQSTPQIDRAFIDALLDSEPNALVESFRAELFQRTRGHPLFTVELLHDMQERGDLSQDQQGRWISGTDVDWDALPARVEAVVSRRIGRLPPLLQEALKIAAVEGETFTAEVIAHILGVAGWEMVRQLSGIVGRQHRVVTDQGTQRLGEQLLSRYRFVHIVFQNYLYGILDPAERTYLHEAVGLALEELAADRTSVVAVQLAHHFQAAVLPTKAVDYLHEAGRQAVALSAHQEAITHLSHALTLLPELPDTVERARRELQLQTDLGVSYKITKGFSAPEVEQVYRRAQILCEPVGDPLSWACVLWGLHSVYAVRGELVTADQTAQVCLALPQDDPILRVTGHCMMGCSLTQTGQFRASRTHLEQARESYTPAQHDTYIFLAGFDLGVFSLANLAHALAFLGLSDQALKVAQEAVTLAEVLAHPFGHAAALSYLAMLHQLHGDWHSGQDVAARARRLCVEYDIPYYLAWNIFLEGWALSEQGHVDQGVAWMEEGLANLEAMQTGLRRPYYLSLLAEACGQIGRIDDGLQMVAAGLAQADAQAQHLYVPDLHRVQAELLRKQGASNRQVEASLQQAIDCARQQEAKLPELRAATSLARLYQDQGNRDAAHHILASTAAWFSEGFEIADLQAARSLLATLT